jgi:phosphonopyruvate decarboxylase
MDINAFINILQSYDIQFYTGIPDSQLKELCDYLNDRYGISDKHVIAANEGACVGLAAGYHLATGRTACIYMQNSGIGNAVNPITSLLDTRVYGIPALFIIGWRGEPGKKDEPQHAFQGAITQKLLEVLDMETYIVSESTTVEQLEEIMKHFSDRFKAGKSAAFLVRKGAFKSDTKAVYKNQYILKRETAVDIISQYYPDDVFVSTTGKCSREIFEIREKYQQGHAHDFLTVGSMGHSSMIALGIALQQNHKRIWCLDGDGAVIMHMGSMALLGANNDCNMVHVILNNLAHETVGGMPTVAKSLDFPSIATACGYAHVFSVDNESDLMETLGKLGEMNGIILLEVKVSIESRSDLGRPTTTTIENKNDFMDYLRKR